MESRIRKAVCEGLPEICERILTGEKLGSGDADAIDETAKRAVNQLQGED